MKNIPSIYDAQATLGIGEIIGWPIFFIMFSIGFTLVLVYFLRQKINSGEKEVATIISAIVCTIIISILSKSLHSDYLEDTIFLTNSLGWIFYISTILLSIAATILGLFLHNKLYDYLMLNYHY